MELKKFAAMAVGAACLTVCAGMSMSANAAGASVSLPKDFSGIGALKTSEETYSASITVAYKNAVLNYADTHSCSFFFTVINMDDESYNDYADELIIFPTDPFEGRVAEVYSYINNDAVKVGEVPIGSDESSWVFCELNNNGKSPLIILSGDYDNRSGVWYSFDGTNVYESNRVESNAQDAKDNICEASGASVTYNEDGTWSSTNRKGETVEGIDLWYFNYVYGGDIMGFIIPESPEIPAIPADADPVEETLIVYDALMNYIADETSDRVPDVVVDRPDFENFYLSFSVFDINKDGIPELIRKVEEAEFLVYDFFTYDPESDSVTFIDEIWTGMNGFWNYSDLFMDKATDQLCMLYNNGPYEHDRIGGIIRCDFVGRKFVTYEKVIQDIEYSGEGLYADLMQYGDFVRADSSENYLRADGSWYHMVGEDVFEGFDTSVFDRYLEDYNSTLTPETPEVPEETTAPETTTKTDSTTTTAPETTTKTDSTTTAASTTAGKTDSPKTGDNTLSVLGAVITIAGLTAFTFRKKND